MKIERRFGRAGGGLALPVVIALLYVGLERLTAMVLSAGWRVEGSLARPILITNLLMIGFLAVGYLGRRVDRGASMGDALGFGGTIVLLAYLSIGLL